MHARALALALEALSLACVAAALGSSGCYRGPDWGECGEPWRHQQSDAGLEPIAVARGLSPSTRYVVLGHAGELVLVGLADQKVVVRGPNETRLHAIANHDSRLIAVGEAGAILASDDDGESWSSYISGTTRDLWAVVGVESGPIRWVAVGDGVVGTSTNGETWTLVDEPEGGWGVLRAATMTESQIWLVGERGAAWSLDLGAGTWVAESVGTSADLLGITTTGRTDVGDGLAAATKSELFVRAPGESAWRRLDMPELDGEIIGLSNGFLVTSKGQVFRVGYSNLYPVPIELDFVPTAIHGRHQDLVVVGRGGRAMDISEAICRGRPLLDEGAWVVARAVARDDWQAGSRSSNDTLDEREASRWRRAALDEHASIASFAIHLLELISLGAPPQLVRAVQTAMRDEVRHAALGFGLARHFGAVAYGPDRLALGSNPIARCKDARAIAIALFEQGCVGETLAAGDADVEARTCTDPRVRAVLEVIASDERRHAALAWSTLRWLIEREPSLREPLRVRLHELASLARPTIHAEIMRELIVPLARRML